MSTSYRIQYCITPQIIWLYRRQLCKKSTGSIGRFELSGNKGVTVNQSGYNDWRVPCSLNVKDLICTFRKRVGKLKPLQKMKFLVPINFPNFLVAVKIGCTSCPFSKCINFYWNCTRPEYVCNICYWTLNNKQ